MAVNSHIRRQRIQQARRNRNDSVETTTKAGEIAIAHLNTLIGRCEFLATNGAIVMLTVVTLVLTLDRETLTDHDMRRMFHEYATPFVPSKKSTSPRYVEFVIASLTLSMLAMMGPIFVAVALPSEAEFVGHDSEAMAPSLRLIDSISPLPTQTRLVCGLPIKPSRVAALRILYVVSHGALIFAIPGMVVTAAFHLYWFVMPLALTSSDCLGGWANADGATSAFYQEGFVWAGTPPFFNASAYEDTLTEDEVFKYKAHCRTNGVHPIIHRHILYETYSQFREGDYSLFLNSPEEDDDARYIKGAGQNMINLPFISYLCGVGLIFPFLTTILAFVNCGSKGKEKTAADQEVVYNNAMHATAEHTFGIDEQSPERLFLSAAGIDDESLAYCVECFQSSGLTVAVLLALKGDNMIRKDLLATAGIDTAGDQGKILVHLADKTHLADNDDLAL
eukprot:gene3932-5151_t